MFPANLHKKALCVGISYKGQRGPYDVPPEDFELEGSHNDVWKVVDLLTGSFLFILLDLCYYFGEGHYGYEKENITVLLDAKDYRQPTRDNIVRSI